MIAKVIRVIKKKLFNIGFSSLPFLLQFLMLRIAGGFDSGALGGPFGCNPGMSVGSSDGQFLVQRFSVLFL